MRHAYLSVFPAKPMDVKDATLLYAGHIVKSRAHMFKIYEDKVNAIALPAIPKGILARRVVFHGGKRARKHGRWSYANIGARLKHRALGPFYSAEDMWRASRSLRRPFQLGMGLMELRARMKFRKGGGPWFVHRFRSPTKLTCAELMWVGLDWDDKTAGKAFLDSAGGARFYVPGSPSQPSWKRLSSEPPRYGVTPARWKAMHAVRGSPAQSTRALPRIPKVAEKVEARRARESWLREVCPAEDGERIDLTGSDVTPENELEVLAGSLWGCVGECLADMDSAQQ